MKFRSSRLVAAFPVLLILLAVLSGCDPTTDPNATATPTVAPTATPTPAPTATPVPGLSGSSAGVPVDEFQGINWATVQSELLSRTTPGYIDTALYFDVYFATQADGLLSTIPVAHIKSTEAAALSSAAASAYMVSVAEILTAKSLTRIDVGTTYYYQIRITDTTGVSHDTAMYTLLITPPQVAGDVTLDRDYIGYYLTWTYDAAYPDTTASVQFGTTAQFAAGTAVVATGLDPLYDQNTSTTSFKVYLADMPYTGLAGATDYYARVSTYNKLDTTLVTTMQNAHHIVTAESVSEDSYWNLEADDAAASNKFLSTAGAATLDSIGFTLNWDNVLADFVGTAHTGVYTVYSGTTAAALTPSVFAVSANSATISGLAYGTTYYFRVYLTVQETGSASAAATYSSPVVAITTPAGAGKVYTFDSGNTMPAAAFTTADPTALYYTIAGTALVAAGNPAPSLQLAAADTIKTAADGALINTYANATLKFDFRPLAVTGTSFVIGIDNGLTPSTFNPTAYSYTTPSLSAGAAWNTLHGAVLAMKYYAADPIYTSGVPSFALYGYYLAADNTVDIDNATVGAQNDADANPDVVEVKLIDLATYSSTTPFTITSQLTNLWKTLTVQVNTTTRVVTVSMPNPAGVASSNNFTMSNAFDSSSVVFNQLSTMTLAAANPVLIDNISYNIGAATGTYFTNKVGTGVTTR